MTAGKSINAFYASAAHRPGAVTEQKSRNLNPLAKEVTTFEKVSFVKEPAVSVYAEKVENLVIIMVSDNGNGILQNIIDKIFQPFFTTKTNGEGTGLRLSFAYGHHHQRTQRNY